MNIPQEVLATISQLDNRFFGTIELTAQDGKIVLLKTTQTTKIYAQRNNRAHDDSRNYE